MRDFLVAADAHSSFCVSFAAISFIERSALIVVTLSSPVNECKKRVTSPKRGNKAKSKKERKISSASFQVISVRCGGGTVIPI